MIGTIGWLIFIWIIVGWGSVIIYAIADVVIKACILLLQGDEDSFDVLFDTAMDADTLNECIQDYYEAHPYISSHIWIELFRWDCLLKIYLSSIRHAVNDVYNERLQLLKKKGGI